MPYSSYPSRHHCHTHHDHEHRYYEHAPLPSTRVVIPRPSDSSLFFCVAYRSSHLFFFRLFSAAAATAAAAAVACHSLSLDRVWHAPNRLHNGSIRYGCRRVAIMRSHVGIVADDSLLHPFRPMPRRVQLTEHFFQCICVFAHAFSLALFLNDFAIGHAILTWSVAFPGGSHDHSRHVSTMLTHQCSG